MMNDTTLNITMHEDTTNPTNETPLPVHDYALMASLISALTMHIERIVDQRFAALVESHRTLALMDDNMETKISHMIDKAIENHESDHEHKTDDDIESEVSHLLDHYMRQGNHDFVTERNLSEKVCDVLDEILEDRINDALNTATVSISI